MENSIPTNYKRLLASSFAEQQLAKSKIYLNIPLLKIMMKARPSEEKQRYYLIGKDDHNISTQYRSKDKITARMFTRPGELNLITLSDPDIKECISSRYNENGRIVELDYRAFEYRIMTFLMDYDLFPNKDIHTKVAEELNIDRNEAKKINNAFFYGMGQKNLRKMINDNEKYIQYRILMEGFMKAKKEFLAPYLEEYVQNGYVINPYGRFIYSKSESTIFNNIIQSTGSDILIDSICAIAKLHKFNMLFHRFDSLFFDFKNKDLYTDLKMLQGLMTKNVLGVKLDVNTSIGKNLNNLARL